ncbi:MAG: hypothetical protein AAFY41_14420, partial [Bacteroidota bacterium]
MEKWEYIPWLLIVLLSGFIIGSLFGLVLQLMKFPAARHLGKLLIAHSFLLLSIGIEDFLINMYQVTILIVSLLFVYARAFFSQKKRPTLIHYIPILISLGLFLTPVLIDQIVASLMTFIYGILLVRLLKKEANQRG